MSAHRCSCATVTSKAASASPGRGDGGGNTSTLGWLVESRLGDTEQCKSVFIQKRVHTPTSAWYELQQINAQTAANLAAWQGT